MHRALHELCYRVLLTACALSCFAALRCGRAAAQPEPEAAGFHATVAAGAGAGARIVRLPTQVAERRVATEPFPALELRVGVGTELKHGALLDAYVHYQSSVGLRAAPQPLDGETPEPRASLRLNSLRIGAGPGYRLVRRSRVAVDIRGFIGWSFRGLRSVTELDVPAYTLQGPLLRPELRVSLGNDMLALSAAPELGLLYSTGAVRDAADAARLGVSLGGEFAADARVIEPLHLVLSYRGSQASLATAHRQRFVDVEHFVTLRVELLY